MALRWSTWDRARPAQASLAFSTQGGGGRDQLWIRRWDNLDATPVPGTEGAGGFTR